jgi:hypothetical protein
MRFKQWFLEFNSGAATSGNGSMQAFPGSNLNTQLPVKSNISCKDGSSKEPLDTMNGKPSPDKVFGFRSPSDRKDSDKRRAQWINNNSKRVPIMSMPPDVIH